MPMMSVKEIRSAVTHMRQYSSGGCGQMTHGQFSVLAGSYQTSRLRFRGEDDPTSPLGKGYGGSRGDFGAWGLEIVFSRCGL